MNKNRHIFITFLIAGFFILLHNSIITFLGNVNSLFRVDNSSSLEENTYIKRIEYLESELSNYELALNNLEIYEKESSVLGKIALRNIYDFYNFLIISTDAKVEEKSPVVNENGLVGMISESNKNTAKVSLITGGCSVSVKIGNIYGLLDEYDRENNLLIIHNVDNYKVIKEGDIVETSGLAGTRKGIYIGRVDHTEKLGIEQVIYVKSDVNFDELNYLLVLT